MPTINKSFGIADPQYDALRVQSNQAIYPDAGGAPPGGAGGLENKIYLWHSDGSTIDTFDADETGLNAALTGAVATDTVWLPSIPIALTAAVTVPAGVALRGISHKSIINASGFSTPAIVLSAGSIIDSFTLNHSDGQWFDASAADSKALRIHGIAARALVGTAPTVSGIWVGELSAVYWLESGVWSKVATNPDANEIQWAGITNDGATLYVCTQGVGGVSTRKLYKCTNPKAVSPTWTSILAFGDSAAGSTISSHFSYTFGPFVINGSNLYTTSFIATSYWIYGIYNGSSWTWTVVNDANVFNPDGVGKDMHSIGNVVRDGANATLETISGGVGYEFYMSPVGTRYCSRSSVTNLFIHQIGGSDLKDVGLSTAASAVNETKITGAETGNQVYVVGANSGADGHLWLSDNGSTFTDIATWAEGWVKDDAISGGGQLIWLPINVIDAATMLRRYTRAGAVDLDLTANFWSVAAAGAKAFKGLSLVYA